MKAASSLMLTLLICTVAWPAELAGVSMADTVTVAGATLHLNGMGVRTKMMFKIYVVGLYLKTPATDARSVLESSGPKRLVMHFLSNKATKDRMKGGWRQGFEANSPRQFPALAERVDVFADLFGDFKKGDRVQLTVVPGVGTIVELNARRLGEIEGDDFGTALLRIWLGPAPPSEQLKEDLLGSESETKNPQGTKKFE